MPTPEDLPESYEAPEPPHTHARGVDLRRDAMTRGPMIGSYQLTPSESARVRASNEALRPAPPDHPAPKPKGDGKTTQCRSCRKWWRGHIDGKPHKRTRKVTIRLTHCSDCPKVWRNWIDNPPGHRRMRVVTMTDAKGLPYPGAVFDDCPCTAPYTSGHPREIREDCPYDRPDGLGIEHRVHGKRP